MVATIFVSIYGLVATTITSLLIADLYRRQIRQVELHRADPSIPLVPPAHPVAAFFQKAGGHLYNLAFIVFLCARLAQEMHKTTPITRADVLYICTLSILLLGFVSVELGTIGYKLGHSRGKTGRWF